MAEDCEYERLQLKIEDAWKIVGSCPTPFSISALLKLIEQRENMKNQLSSVDILDKVKSIQQQRAAEYEQDGGERSFAKIATIYNTLRGADLLPSDIALILSILKDVRFYSQDGLHMDSVIDKVSYSSLWGELIVQERY
jgi:hypothetical protein